MIFRKPDTKGETLAETIIALSVLAIAITMASTVILNSMRNLSNSKQRVIAVNLAREGIEAVRSIRDSNWLLYSSSRRQCWNHDPSSGVCNGGTPILPGTYIVYKHAPEGGWRLQLADEAPGIDSGSPPDGIPDNDLDLIPLSLVDIDPSTDSDGEDPDESGDGLDDDTDMYNHMLAGVTDPYGIEATTTPFSRYVVIEYLENQPGGDSSITPPNDAINTVTEWNNATSQAALNRMRITSVVDWSKGGVSYSVELKTIITDHLGREDLNS